MGLLSKPSADELAVGDVHRHFKAETHFGVLRLAPHSFLQRVRQIDIVARIIEPGRRNDISGTSPTSPKHFPECLPLSP